MENKYPHDRFLDSFQLQLDCFWKDSLFLFSKRNLGRLRPPMLFLERCAFFSPLEEPEKAATGIGKCSYRNWKRQLQESENTASGIGKGSYRNRKIQLQESEKAATGIENTA
ncbi:hypothetical protein AVEN_198395-1 [Araneus ventricosus]|uniref:Uncharacterized protein n=1 Tax=Araneus ventricosus TaxID=182803 RepID=A0A4Y2FKV4_ARAVE|nr:hypothetical protein AVEN_198395-1 [Araneus ventricosus]